MVHRKRSGRHYITGSGRSPPSRARQPARNGRSGMEKIPFKLEAGFAARGRPARGDREARRGPGRRAERIRRCSASPGAGKTYVVSQVIQQVQRPTLVLAHNKTLAAQLYGEFRELLSAEFRRVLRLLLRLLPAGSVRAVLRHLHREGLLDQRAHRADAAFGDQGAARASGLDHRRHRLLDLRPRRSEGLSVDGPAPGARRPHRSAQAPAAPGGHAVHAQRHGPDTGHLSRARRCDRHFPGGVGARGGAGRALRRHHRLDRALRSADRRGRRARCRDSRCIPARTTSRRASA